MICNATAYACDATIVLEQLATLALPIAGESAADALQRRTVQTATSRALS
jgi:hypothetical protein